MYTGTMDSASNSADLIFVRQIVDDDTKDPIDLTDALITFAVLDRIDEGFPYRGSPLLVATTDNGKITLVDEGTFQVWFPLSDMNVLTSGYYDVTCTIAQNGITTQLMVAELPIVEGGRVTAPAATVTPVIPTPPTPTPTAPTNSVAPVISGTPQSGQTLTSTTGTWANSPTAFAYQWNAGGVVIVGATSNTFLLTDTQVGANITCTVTASNTAGSASATSNSLGPVTAAGSGIGLELSPGVGLELSSGVGLKLS